MTDKKTTPAMKYECSECGRQEETKEGFDIDNNPHIVGCPASDDNKDRCIVQEIPAKLTDVQVGRMLQNAEALDKSQSKATLAHTPAPWVVASSGWVVASSGSSIYTGGVRHPKTICVMDASCPLAITPEVEANASLIASAPELLEVCKSHLDELKAIPDSYQWIRRHIQELEEAISKAKGNSPS